MGTSGPGVFDNDRALGDYGEVVNELVKDIDALQGMDDTGIHEINGELALVEILAVLGEYCRPIYLERARLDRWRQRYLEVHDAEFNTLDPDEEHKAARRRVIESTFDRLGRHIRHANDPAPSPAAAAAVAPTGGAAAAPAREQGALNVTREVSKKRAGSFKQEAEKAGAKKTAEAKKTATKKATKETAKKAATKKKATKKITDR